MDQTQRMDPNKTMLSGAPGFDPMRTQAMSPMGDPNRTAAMSAMPVGPSLTAAVTSSREVTMANGPAREQFLLELTAGGMAGFAGGRTPLNLCLVIDRSGSMEGMPLEYAKHACTHVVDLLSSNDILSIVTFEEVVDLLMPPQQVLNKDQIKQGISQIQPGNTTNLHGGISLALQQVMQMNDPGRATRIIVLSDGDPTAGIKDYTSLVNFSSEVKARGVTITFLGFGPDYNEELLAGMAKKSGGNYYFIPRPEMIPEVFRTELERLMTVVARNLKLDLEIARWVTLRSNHGQLGTERSVSIQLADLERGTTMEQVFDFEFTNHPLGHYRVASGVLTYDDGSTGKQETVNLDFVMEFSSDSARYSAQQNPKVRGAADLALASRAVEKTIMGLKNSQITAQMAIADLQKTQALLLQQGRTQDAQEVTLALRAIQSGDTGSAEKTLMGTMVNLDQGKR